MSSPFLWAETGFSPGDLEAQNAVLSQLIQDIFPCRSVFLAGINNGTSYPECDPGLLAGIENVVAGKKSFLDRERPIVYMPLGGNEELVGVAVIEADDDAFSGHTEKSLESLSRTISRELSHFAAGAKDPLTGLANAEYLRKEIALYIEKGPDKASLVNNDFVLVLIETWPREKNAEAAAGEIKRSAGVLKNIFGNSVQICHLGNGVFGLLWDGSEPEQTVKMCEVIIRRLRNEDFSTVHVGIRPAHKGENSDFTSIFEDAWQCLRTARARGSAAHCLHQSPEDLATHPLRPFPEEVTQTLAGLWRREKEFALILFKEDFQRGGKTFSGKALALVGGNNQLFELGAGEGCVYLPGVNIDKACEWGREFQEKLQGIESITFSAGVAAYPLFNFTKAETLLNARKALLHDSFFGPGTMTVFDAVSQNICGDVYYDEGDLLQAIREYRTGIKMDPENVNLLNSLGVAYMQADEPKKAVAVFERALQVDSHDFMALYNLGLLWSTSGENSTARGYFEKAVAVEKENVDAILQLARLYVLSCSYTKVVNLLVDGGIIHGDQFKVDGMEHENGGGVISRYLGEAYKGLNDNRRAMIWLQRASRLNPSDPDVLSMLGEVYAAENQGKDIALSLCKRAVELDGESWLHWYRLGKVQAGCNKLDEAIDSILQSLALGRNLLDPTLLLAEVYQRAGKNKEAQKSYRKVLKIHPRHKKAAAELKKLQSKGSKK